MSGLISADLTYQINGCVFDVYNELGFGYQEKYYYRAIRNKLNEKGLSYKEQLYCALKSGEKSIGCYYLDFLVSNKIVLEIKVANQVYPKHIKQVLGYLKSNKLKLGILAVFTKDGVIIKRIIN